MHPKQCPAGCAVLCCAVQIELDLPRTFPRHAWLASPEGQDALRAVLTAYTGHNSAVGYCQVSPDALGSAWWTC
jgi:hypothetical protein